MTPQMTSDLVTLALVVLGIMLSLAFAAAIRHADRRSARADWLTERIETTERLAETYLRRAERAEGQLNAIRHPRVPHYDDSRRDAVDRHLESVPHHDRDATSTRVMPAPSPILRPIKGEDGLEDTQPMERFGFR